MQQFHVMANFNKWFIVIDFNNIPSWDATVSCNGKLNNNNWFIVIDLTKQATTK